MVVGMMIRKATSEGDRVRVRELQDGRGMNMYASGTRILHTKGTFDGNSQGARMAGGM